MSRRRSRDVRSATSDRRLTWYGWGKIARVPKTGFGQFLHDLARMYGDVSFSALPFLFLVWLSGEMSLFGFTTATIGVWFSLVFVGTLIRGGWIRPVLSDTPGWVAVAPSMIALRLVYYNVAMAISVFAAVTIGSATLGPLVIPASIGLGVLVAVLFPRIADTVYDRL